MKKWLFLLLALPSLHFAEEAPQPAGLLPLTTKPVMQLDASTRKAIQEQDAREIAEMERLLQTRTFPWHVLVGMAFVALVVAVLGKWLWDKWKARRARQEDPVEEGLQKLKLLEARQLPSKGLYDVFFVELTSITRHFIERQRGMLPGEASSDKGLNAIFKGVEPIKFGRQPSSLEESARVLQEVRELVLQLGKSTTENTEGTETEK